MIWVRFGLSDSLVKYVMAQREPESKGLRRRARRVHA